jgi:dolichol-phosphate mannosyltransferase
VPFAGFGTIVGLIVVIFSLLVGILGIISEYLALIYTELKNRPLGIVRDITANNSDDN